MFQAPMKRRFPRLLNWAGYAFVLCSWLLAAELIWEQTALSWERGPQMVGFSLMHSGAGALLLLAVFAGLAWALAMLIAAAITRSLPRKSLALLAAYALALGMLATPYGFWQRLFISKISPAHACEFSTYAAAGGDLQTVKAFVKHGTSVNCMGRDGTPLHAAAVRGQLDVAEYLLASGADANALNPFGDSVLAVAMQAESRQAETRALLVRHGATLVRGSQEQHDRVLDEQMRKDIEDLKSEMPR